MKHLLITGYMGVGKSTMIQKLIETMNCPVSGFLTKKEDELADAVNGSPIYIYEPGKPRTHGPENLLGYCNDRKPTTIPGSFDRWACRLNEPAAEGGVIVFDEIGFMESREEAFVEAIMKRLDGDVPVIAAVKDCDTELLLKIRQHPRCECLYLNVENRDEIWHRALAHVQQWRKD